MALFWIIWDAASKDVVDKMIKDEKLPNLKKVFNDGIGYRVKLKQLNCQTPCALAVQFTGRKPEDMGIGGFYTPDLNEHQNCDSYTSTFENKDVKESVLWNEKYIGDRKIGLCQIPFYNKLQKNLFYLDGFTSLKYEASCFYANEMTWEDKLDAYSNKIQISYVDVFDTKFEISICEKLIGTTINLIQCETGKRINVKLDDFDLNRQNEFWLSDKCGFVFLAYQLEDNNCIFIFTDVYQYSFNGISDIESFKKKVGPFIGRALGKLYRKGGFGVQKYLKGNGKADKIFMNLVNYVANYFCRLNLYIIKQNSYDMVISYQPCIDEVSHEIYGWYINSTEGQEKEFFENMLFYTYQLADKHLGKLLQHKSNEDNIIISSDHGIYAVNKTFYINSYLYQNGLLDIKGDHTINFSKTKVFYHSCNSGALFFNPTIDESEKKDIVESIKRITISGEKVISDIIDTNNNRVFGDYFVEPGEGINVDSALKGLITEYTNKTGSHTCGSSRKSMNAIFYGSGEGFSKLEKEKDILNSDIKEIVLACLEKSWK